MEYVLLIGIIVVQFIVIVIARLLIEIFVKMIKKMNLWFAQ